MTELMQSQSLQRQMSNDHTTHNCRVGRLFGRLFLCLYEDMLKRQTIKCKMRSILERFTLGIKVNTQNAGRFVGHGVIVLCQVRSTPAERNGPVG